MDFGSFDSLFITHIVTSIALPVLTLVSLNAIDTTDISSSILVETNSTGFRFVSLFTLSDVLAIVLHLWERQIPGVLEELSKHRVLSWTDYVSVSRPRPPELVCLRPEESLLSALRSLRSQALHRAPVMHEGAPLFIFSHANVISYLVSQILHEDVPVCRATIESLELHTRSITPRTVTRSESLSACILQLKERSISSMPVVDDRGSIIGIISRTDLARLVLKNFNMSMTVGDLLATRSGHVSLLPVYHLIHSFETQLASSDDKFSNICLIQNWKRSVSESIRQFEHPRIEL